MGLVSQHKNDKLGGKLGRWLERLLKLFFLNDKHSILFLGGSMKERIKTV
jgi:hypothetical protein